MKKYIAETLGAFTLTFVVGLSIVGMFPVPTPVLAGLVLMLFVYSIGHVSGCHINPAVTLGLWSIKKVNTKDAMGYIISQMVGAFIAMVLISTVGQAPDSMGLVTSNSWMVFVAELIGTLFFAFGIASVVYGKTPKEFSGVVVGGSLLLGVAISSLLGANGVLNPAVAFGIGSFGIMYITGPIVGAVLGMQIYKQIEN
jgi:glycerol uptake facilitator-like aquaporin